MSDDEFNAFYNRVVEELNSSEEQQKKSDMQQMTTEKKKEEASEKTIGNNKKCTKSVTEKKKDHRWIKKFFATAFVTVVLLVGLVKITVAINDAIVYAADVKSATSITQEIMADRLVDTGSAHYEKGGDFSVKAMSIEDYSQLGVDTPEELFTLMQVIDDDTEVDNMVKAISYVDNEGNVYYYTDFSQYLRLNGYCDEDGKADIEEFEDFCENSIVNSYRDGNLREEFTEGLKVDSTKGGKNI